VICQNGPNEQQLNALGSSVRLLTPLLLLLSFALPALGQSTELKGVGRFETLDNPLVADKLELKVVEDKVSVRRFRQLWQDVFAVGADRQQWLRHSDDLSRFLELTRGPLKANDYVVIERQGNEAVVSINYREHARLSSEFLTLMVDTLTARIAPIPQLREGLLGMLPDAEQDQLVRQFIRGEPSLGRIGETARWLRRPTVADKQEQVTQL
jgi:hypothetical protein